MCCGRKTGCGATLAQETLAIEFFGASAPEKVSPVHSPDALGGSRSWGRCPRDIEVLMRALAAPTYRARSNVQDISRILIN